MRSKYNNEGVIMKIKKIPGLGSYGHYIDDLDFDNMTDEEWMEIGKFHLTDLVTILRNVKITKDQYYHRVKQFGPFIGATMSRKHFQKKYGQDFDARIPGHFQKFNVSPQDERYLKLKQHYIEHTEHGNTLTRVSGKKDKDGNPTGNFSSGELYWHSNESSVINFTPGVALMGGENMVGSSTGFLQTADYYASVSESFRSELNEMVLIHAYIPGGINELEKEDPNFGENIRAEFAPVDGAEVPLVITSPGGIKGLHYTLNSVVGIKGMSKAESDKVFRAIDSELLTDKYIYDHMYLQDNDICLFDNSITLHRRKHPGNPNRLAFRLQYYPNELINSSWHPYAQTEFYNKHQEEMMELISILELDLKFP
jgi:alpha-ketoglutarate-dependent taurine dioxygenase